MSALVEIIIGVACAYFLLSVVLFFFPSILHRKKRNSIKAKAIAHRGGGAEFLENTMTAFRNAVHVGADLLELDVQLTKDKKIVICHDNNLTRLTGHQILISETCYEDLPQISVPQRLPWIPGIEVSHTDRRIPLLEELFTEFPTIPINLDVKEPDVNLRIQVESLIRKYNRESITIWGSWSDSTCSQLFKLNPNIPLIMSFKKIVVHALIMWLGLLPFVPIKESFYEPPFFAAMTSQMKRTFKQRLLYTLADLLVCNRLLLYHYKRRGIVRWCWIINDDSKFEDCFARFDGVMTDRITALVEFVTRREEQKRLRKMAKKSNRNRSKDAIIGNDEVFRQSGGDKCTGVLHDITSDDDNKSTKCLFKSAEMGKNGGGDGVGEETSVFRRSSSRSNTEDPNNNSVK